MRNKNGGSDSPFRNSQLLPDQLQDRRINAADDPPVGVLIFHTDPPALLRVCEGRGRDGMEQDRDERARDG